MDISLKLGTKNFLKSQLTSADTLLKPLFDNSGDHLLIKELTTSGDYSSLKGQLDLSKDLFLLVYINLNSEQSAIFEDKLATKFSELTLKTAEPIIFKSQQQPMNYLAINTFSNKDDLNSWKKLMDENVKQSLTVATSEPLKYFTKTYQRD